MLTFEQFVSELSKKKLSKYVVKASDNLADRSAEYGTHGPGERMTPDEEEKNMRDQQNRYTGIRKAAKRLAK